MVANPDALLDTIRETAQWLVKRDQRTKPAALHYSEQPGKFHCETCRYATPGTPPHGECQLLVGPINMETGGCSAWDPDPARRAVTSVAHMGGMPDRLLPILHEALEHLGHNGASQGGPVGRDPSHTLMVLLRGKRRGFSLPVIEQDRAEHEENEGEDHDEEDEEHDER